MSISNAIAAIEARAAGLGCPVHFSGALVEKPEPPSIFATVEVDCGPARIAGVGGGGAALRHSGSIDFSLFAPHAQRAALLAAVDEALTLFPVGLRLGGVSVWEPTVGRVETAEGDIGWLVCEVNIRFTVDQ